MEDTSCSKFKIGDRVFRKEQESKGVQTILKGTVVSCYSRDQYICGSIILGPYPELYMVQFDDGRIGRAFLPHGLQPLKENVL